LGFLIEEKATKERLLFATDTYYIKYNFKSLNYLVIEANHSLKILDENVALKKLNPSLKKRIQESHFSIENLKEFLLANDISAVKKIILIHLSENNSNAEQFRKEIFDLTQIETIIADPNMEIELKLCPF